MATARDSYQIIGNDFDHAGEAAIKVRNLLQSLGIDPGIIRRIAICSYEAEMNAVMHGGGGSLSFEVNSESIILEVSDSGDGIENIDSAMVEGFSTAKDEHREIGFGAGMGLPNIKKNADDMTLTSRKGEGTHVRLVFSRFKEDTQA